MKENSTDCEKLQGILVSVYFLNSHQNKAKPLRVALAYVQTPPDHFTSKTRGLGEGKGNSCVFLARPRKMIQLIFSPDIF